MMDHSIINPYMDGRTLHQIFASLLFIPYVWYIYVLFTFKTYKALNSKLFFIMPIVFFLVAVSFFSGIFLLAMRHFVMDFKISAMIFVFLCYAIGEGVRLKKIKFARTSEERFAKYVKGCKIMYICFLVLYIIMMGIAEGMN
ncbi:hypothetical protein [Helicobacter sp. 11S02629-2]|uniref:hypothetical protein n=1 Tax=Helicobacter sp. 11S02629-2 TaxID=1476195 RepID=UPI000BA54644|nr:hypothetical protein [Helicobacter sp. 11S02629-2]PAF43275.1 hypothetical protein BKH40_07170 [Helicobacter sp. 11S02629-2]